MVGNVCVCVGVCVSVYAIFGVCVCVCVRLLEVPYLMGYRQYVGILLVFAIWYLDIECSICWNVLLDACLIHDPRWLVFAVLCSRCLLCVIACFGCSLVLDA